MERESMSFKKLERSYSAPNGWRLATFEEAKKGLETIKKDGFLNKWDRARLLDGWISGPGYDFQMGDDFRGCLGYMLLIRTQETENLASGSATAYSDVDICDSQKEVALFLCVDDWNYEVVYWVLNCWSKTQSMDLRDVRDGRIPFSNAGKFKDMNQKICSLAKKLGDVGPVSEKAAKRKFSGRDSVKEVLSGMIDIVNEENIEQFYSEEFVDLDEVKESCFPWSLEPPWLEDVASQGKVEWNTIADVLWNFLSESFAGTSVEIFGSFCLAETCKLNNQFDLKTITSSQENFIVASSILSLLSYFRTDIIHEPLGHECWKSCAAKIIHYVASKNEPAELQSFNQTLQNNAMWRCYDRMGNYGLLNKLLIIAANGSPSRILQIEQTTDILVINMLLECGAQPGTTCKINNFQQQTALHGAAMWEDEDLGTEVAKKLLDKCNGRQQKELVNAQDGMGRSALHWASLRGQAHMCQMLIDKGASLDAVDKRGKTALHVAVERMKDVVTNVFMKHPDITELVDLKDKRGYSPLDIAIVSANIELVAKLLSMSKQPEVHLHKVDPQELLRQCLLHGCDKIVLMLFDKEAELLDLDGDDDNEGKTSLHLASMCEDESKAMEMVDIILGKTKEEAELVAKRDKRGRTALQDAALNGHKTLCDRLLHINPEIITIKDRDGGNPLYDAVRGKQNDEDVLTMLLEAYSEKDIHVDDLIDRRGLTPLHVAASQGKTHLVKVLLSSQKKSSEYLKKGDFLGQTALHKAAKYGDSSTVKILLEQGAQPLKERDCDGRTALHYAVQAKTEGDKKELVNLLLQGCKSNEEKLLLLWASAAGLGTADQNLRNGDDLHKFLTSKKKEIKEKLEQRNDNLLKIAASMGDMEMTKELISRGYQIVDIKDQQWRSKLKPENEKNVRMVSRQLEKIKEQGNDQPTISDNLGRADYAHGLAALFLNPYVKPPIAVGISGSWGMGKSSLMVQTESILLQTAAQMALLPSSKLSTSALKLPDIKTFVLSKKGEKKYEEIKRLVDHEQKVNRNFLVSMMDKFRSWIMKRDTEERQAENGHAEQDSLWDFLNNYEVKYRKIFKSLAAMNSSDMFTTTSREAQEDQRSYSKIMYDIVKMMWDMFTGNGQQSKTYSPKETDSSEDGSVPAVLTVQYNAWKYRNETEALAGMAVEITKELEGIMTQAQWLSTCWRNTWKKKKYKIWIEIIYPCLLTLVLAFTFIWIVWVMLDRYKFKDWAKAKYACLPAAIVIIGWTMTKSTMGILKPVSTQLMNYISFPDHTDKLGYQERVISDITFLKEEIGKKPHMVFAAFSWVITVIAALWLLITEWWVTSLFSHGKCLGKTMSIPKVAPASGTNLRIIVFIDDLDRCQESVILQVLSAINLVLAVCEINVVLGIDKGLIERAIIKKFGDMKTNKSFKDSQELADKYLQKIIQLPLDLPDPSGEQSRKFLEGQLGVLQKPSKDADTELKNDAGLSKTLSRKISMPAARRFRQSRQGNDTVREVAPAVNTDSRITIEVENNPEINTSASLPLQSGREVDGATRLHGQEAPPGTDVATISHAENKISDGKSWFSFSIREMLFIRYSQGEQDAFCYFQNLATDCRKLPREWKRLLTYHRLVWNIFSVSKEARDLAGWQVQMITWIFICWEWKENLNFVIENWNNVAAVKTSGSTGPSLEMIVENIIEHESNKKMQVTAARHEVENIEETVPEVGISKNKNIETEIKLLKESAKEDMVREHAGQPSKKKKKKKKKVVREISPQRNIVVRSNENESTKGAGQGKMDNDVKVQLETLIKELDELKKEMKDLNDQVLKQHSRKNEKWEQERRLKLRNWERLRSALHRYDVPMEAIQAFQRFRFYCKAGHLSWPLSIQQNEEPW